jgi:hypothetical protein
MIEAAQADIADFVIDVYLPATLVLLALAGIPIAVLDAADGGRGAAQRVICPLRTVAWEPGTTALIISFPL